jgi:hypothetical protein
MTETPQQITWRLEQECIQLRERAERAERKVKRLEAALVESNRLTLTPQEQGRVAALALSSHEGAQDG